MTEQAAHRIVYAIEIVSAGIYPPVYTMQMHQDVVRIKDRYQQLREQMPFDKAMCQAQTEFILSACEEDTP